MASTTISLVYNDIFEKEPQGMFDDGYECSIASDGMMMFHHYHDDGDVFMFGRLVFAKEIQTIFVTDIYGFNFHSFADETEFTDMDGLDHNEHCFSQFDFYDFIKDKYPSYTNVVYGGDQLLLAAERYKENISKQAPILANCLPLLAVGTIMKNQVPAWTVEDYYEPINIKDMFSLDPKDYSTARAWFQNLLPLYMIIN
jgi:hypothetical protein